MKNLRSLIILGIAAAILLLPLIAMQFDSGVDWDSRDFIVMGIMLFGTAFTIELALRKFNTTKSRIISCTLIVGALFCIWIELAGGVFGTLLAGS